MFITGPCQHMFRVLWRYMCSLPYFSPSLFILLCFLCSFYLVWFFIYLFYSGVCVCASFMSLRPDGLVYSYILFSTNFVFVLVSVFIMLM